MGKTLPITFNKGNCGKIEKQRNHLWEICGKTGTGNIVFLSFFWWFGASAPLVFVVVCVMSPTPPQSRRDLYIYIYTAPDRLPRPSPAARQPVHTNIYIYICMYKNTDVLNMRLHLVEIYQNTKKQNLQKHNMFYLPSHLSYLFGKVHK